MLEKKHSKWWLNDTYIGVIDAPAEKSRTATRLRTKAGPVESREAQNQLGFGIEGTSHDNPSDGCSCHKEFTGEEDHSNSNSATIAVKDKYQR